MFSIDDPPVNDVVFHPRPEGSGTAAGAISTETAVDGAVVGGDLHRNENSAVLMLFFHGNGEIAADYAALAHLYTGCGVSFWVVDYRGYGRSTGSPTFSRMLADAESVLEYIPAVEATARIRFSRIIVMGRSLGSVPAIEVALHYQADAPLREPPVEVYDLVPDHAPLVRPRRCRGRAHEPVAYLHRADPEGSEKLGHV